jgi:hypothetical protein
MAARYWILGTGTWSSSNTTNWSATSGGTGGASVPTSADTPIFDANSGSGVVTFTNGGVTVGTTTINNSGIELRLGAAFTTSGILTLTTGTFTTNNYNVTATNLSSSNSNTRTINLGSSTVTLSSGSTSVNFSTSTNLTFNAGTSSIVLSGTGNTFSGGGRTFYNVSFTPTTSTAHAVNGENTYNNLSFAGRTTAGITGIILNADQTITGTLTISAGTNATMRTFVRSDTLGTTRTLTCAAVASLTDIDFRDITIAGAAAPVSGTRLGDCKGNSGITFSAAKTVYWRLNASNNWSSTTWALTAGGVPSDSNFPLAQDTAVFTSGALTSGNTATVNAAYNIGTIDMSARTTNTMTLATGTTAPIIYGNWINGIGTTLTGTGTLTFAGRGSQTITSAGKTFTQLFRIESPGGSVTLQDAFNSNANSSQALYIIGGTFSASMYNVTLVGGVTSAGGLAKQIDIGTGTWTLQGGAAWTAPVGGPLTVAGTGTISLTSASAKTFAGGDIQTYPTINQGGTGTLTITGSNKFANITNTAIGRVQFTGGTTNEFTAFNLNGTAGNLLALGSTNTTQVTLKAPSWNVGANSTDAGNNTGLTFGAGSVDYLSVSYVNGVVTVAPTSDIYYGATNVASIYYGSTPVTAIYYGAAQVF